MSNGFWAGIKSLFAKPKSTQTVSWSVGIDGIPPRLIKSITRPNVSFLFNELTHDNLTVELVDDLNRNLVNELLSTFDVTRYIMIEYYDDKKRVVQRTHFYDAKIMSVDFGTLKCDDSAQLPVITVKFKYSRLDNKLFVYT